VVDAVGGIRVDFPTPVRDDDNGHDNSGLLVTTPAAGCWTATRPWPAVAPPWPATTRADGTGPPGPLRPWDPRPC
jgi:hypothetical protein